MGSTKQDNMEQLIEAAERFSAIMRDKGYTGSFLTPGGYARELPNGLKSYLAEITATGSDKLSKGFFLETYLQWNGEDRDSIQAHFRTVYKDGEFEVMAMDIAHKSRYNVPIKTCSLNDLTTVNIPDIKQAIESVKPPRQRQGFSSSRGFRYALAICLLMLLPGKTLFAQSTWWKEWFQQKKTQKEYLATQIVALQAYIEVAKRGYNIAQKGLTTISNIKDGDFNLHRDFFGSLQMVNPSVRNYAKVADIIAMQLEIINGYKRDMNSLRRGGLLQPDEMDYVSGVYARLLDDCAKVVDELIQLTTDNSLKMEDDERIQRIELLYEDMRQNRAFLGVFGGQAKSLAAERHRDLQEVQSARNWNGIR